MVVPGRFVTRSVQKRNEANVGDLSPNRSWGGSRPRAGRPTTAFVEARDNLNRVINDQVVPDVPKIIEALKALAYGVKATVPGPDGSEVEVYSTPPDSQALAALVCLINRVA
jgi:hypothetical protein